MVDGLLSTRNASSMSLKVFNLSMEVPKSHSGANPRKIECKPLLVKEKMPQCATGVMRTPKDKKMVDGQLSTRNASSTKFQESTIFLDPKKLPTGAMRLPELTKK